MLANYRLVLFFTIIIFNLSSAFNDEELSKPLVSCGLYGFRCLDTKRAEICDEKKNDNEESSKKPRIFECAEGLVCNEEKIEFCSPKEIHENRNNSSCTCSKEKFHKRDSSHCPCRRSRAVKSGKDELFDDIMNVLTKILPDGTSDFEEDEPTTEKTEIDAWNGSPPIKCDMHGFYPDNNNKSRFFFCDLKKKGDEFVLRHMLCGPNRFFEPNFKACVLKGSTRSIRHFNDQMNNKPKIISSTEDSNFTCDEKKPGKYPDRHDCHIYHICLSKKLYEPFEHLTVECPHSTAFDPSKKKCSKKALRLSKDNSVQKIYCDQEIRFRELRSCDRYFLCYKDQIFQFMCPQGFKFDISMQFCEPEHFVRCE